MHWIIQKNIFKPINYQILIESLKSQNIPYISVIIPPKTLELSPDVIDLTNVYVCGAIKMAKIASQKNWYPGSFLNSNYNFSIWLNNLKDDLLNANCQMGKLNEININNLERFFIRPAEDNKAFDGMVMDIDTFQSWRKSDAKKNINSLDIIVSPLKQIYQEYRFFVVDYKIVTASLYKMEGKPFLSSIIPDDATDYVKSIIKKWLPSASVVIDIAMTEQGWKIIEFNNINSSGFYAIDVSKYVFAIQRTYTQ